MDKDCIMDGAKSTLHRGKDSVSIGASQSVARSLLDIKNLSVHVKSTGKEIVKDVSLVVPEHARIGIVGESGSGKTTLLHVISSFTNQKALIESGGLYFEGKNLLTIPFKERRALCVKEMSVILQDSMNSLNPHEKVGQQLIETYQFTAEKTIDEKMAREKVLRCLDDMGLHHSEDLLDVYPYELSGGMRQRISIILALLSEHIKILLADEPTTALDVINQYNFITFFERICAEKSMTLIYVSHDIRVLNQLCDYIVVMKDGEIVEQGPSEQVIHAPREAYTKLLIDAAKYL